MLARAMHLQYVNGNARPPGLMTLLAYCKQNTDQLLDQYESLAFEEVRTSLHDLLSALGATILDIGAVWAVISPGSQPMPTMPSPSNLPAPFARTLRPSPYILWRSESLPELVQVRRLCLTFNYIVLSSV